MMRQLLDCTLRDGGYLVDKNFNDNAVRGIIHGLTYAGLDYVEIGFLQDDLSKGESTVFLNSQMAKKWIPSERTAVYTVLADYSRYSVANLDEYDGSSFDAVRACFFKHERKDVIPFARDIINKGYRLFIQPVDILGYSHKELLELIDDVNMLNPEVFSLVDTFGSMYLDDLRTLFSLVHHNLCPKIKLGFHSHNNMQMSSALSQEFVALAQNRRDCVVDATLFGMGRGAGNTPTELMAQYLNVKMDGNYSIDKILDCIDNYITPIKLYCKWGYDVPMFLSGCFSSHVNNVSYLSEKPSLRFQDLRIMLNKLDVNERKRYDYEHLEKLYLDYVSQTDLEDDFAALSELLSGKKILVIAPGRSVAEETMKINQFIEREKPTVISVNFIPDHITPDYLYCSNLQRFDYWKYDADFVKSKKILTSNIGSGLGDYTIALKRLLKGGWSNLDNSTILLLRLLEMVKADSVILAGFDGYKPSADNYTSQEVEREIEDYRGKNEDIKKMFLEISGSTKMKISFLTKSVFGEVGQ